MELKLNIFAVDFCLLYGPSIVDPWISVLYKVNTYYLRLYKVHKLYSKSWKSLLLYDLHIKVVVYKLYF